MKLILIRLAAEIATKGKNRRDFINALRRNIKNSLYQNEVAVNVNIEHLRIYVELHDETQMEAACEVLQRVFGIASFSPVYCISNEIDTIKQTALEVAQKAGLDETKKFCIRSRRSNKLFPLESKELDRQVGGFVKAHTNSTVNIKLADVTVGIEVGKNETKVYAEIIRGAGGMPIGTHPALFVLLSSGIDSSVAAWMMMKRGCNVIPIHFTQDEGKAKKVTELAEQLSKWSSGWPVNPLIIDHHGELGPVVKRLEEIGKTRWTCLFCKRSMIQYCNTHAGYHKAHGIVMGDSLGQVASQTLENMTVISDGSVLPILRPLIGLDKLDIIDIAKKIGTFDLSIQKEEGCPFLPSNPLTMGSLKKLKEIEEQL